MQRCLGSESDPLTHEAANMEAGIVHNTSAPVWNRGPIQEFQQRHSAIQLEVVFSLLFFKKIIQLSFMTIAQKGVLFLFKITVYTASLS